MAQLISPQRKQEIIVSLELKIQESVEKISLYNDIYTYVDDMEPTHIPDSEVLPLKGYILREVYFKRDKMEKKIKKQRRLLRVVKNLRTTEESYEEGDEDLRGRHQMSGEEILELYRISKNPVKRQRNDDNSN
jgi:hypothetical protein